MDLGYSTSRGSTPEDTGSTTDRQARSAADENYGAVAVVTDIDALAGLMSDEEIDSFVAEIYRDRERNA